MRSTVGRVSLVRVKRSSLKQLLVKLMSHFLPFQVADFVEMFVGVGASRVEICLIKPNDKLPVLSLLMK